jgi:hypothetical protein
MQIRIVSAVCPICGVIWGQRQACGRRRCANPHALTESSTDSRGAARFAASGRGRKELTSRIRHFLTVEAGIEFAECFGGVLNSLDHLKEACGLLEM